MLFTDSFVARNIAKIRGALSAITRYRCSMIMPFFKGFATRVFFKSPKNLIPKIVNMEFFGYKYNIQFRNPLKLKVYIKSLSRRRCFFSVNNSTLSFIKGLGMCFTPAMLNLPQFSLHKFSINKYLFAHRPTPVSSLVSQYGLPEKFFASMFRYYCQHFKIPIIIISLLMEWKWCCSSYQLQK